MQNGQVEVVTPPGEHRLSDTLAFFITEHAVFAVRNRYTKWPADFNSDGDVYPVG
jgi:hypothetical protein